MRANPSFLALLVPLSLAACILPGGPISPYGRHARVDQRGATAVSGELIAATTDTLWVLRDSTLTALPIPSVIRIKVDRHRFGGKRTMLLSALAGVGTGGALAIACGRYNAMPDESPADCGSVFPTTLLSFVLAGAVMSLINEHSSKHHLRPSDTFDLRTFSRFPQGLPDSVRKLPVLPQLPRVP